MLYILYVYHAVRRRLRSMREAHAAEEGEPAAEATLSESTVHAELRQRSRYYILVFGVINGFRLANRTRGGISKPREVHPAFLARGRPA